VEPIVLDTDVASLIFKGNAPASLMPKLAGLRPCITFVTMAEMTKWAELRSWGVQRRERLARWLDHLVVLPGTEDVGRTWGRISALADRRGRPRPINDTWIAACCLVYEAPLATLNVKDYVDFVEHEGLTIVSR
jgi:predicted nucleic acid-binding protein